MTQFSLCKASRTRKTEGFRQRHNDFPSDNIMKAEMRNAKTSQPNKALQKFYFIRFILLLGAALTLCFASNVFAADAVERKKNSFVS